MSHMKVLMLGWEYPPHIAGGLGIACEGLTKALARRGVEVTFVVPRLYGGEKADHMQLAEPAALQALARRARARRVAVAGSAEEITYDVLQVPAALKPYWNETEYESYIQELIREGRAALFESAPLAEGGVPGAAAVSYGPNIFDEVAAYAARCVQAVGGAADFDVVHAHDWMTFVAGSALSQRLGVPLIVHVHSLEYDRSGGHHGNERIRAIESLGLHSAAAVIAVSHYTKRVISEQHGVAPERIHVVHNGIYPKAVHGAYCGKWKGDRKIVLFLGRITIQKGPDYFVRAAAKVIPHVPNVLFVMAGTGDMLARCLELARELGVSEHFEFPGFLRESEVERMLSAADLYVMPSVSEPFGISALEAIDFDTPSLISKQSGVSEVLGHSLKFDFWDVDRLADLIINGLLHEELRQDMIEMARHELRRVRWDAAAEKAEEAYRRVIN